MVAIRSGRGLALLALPCLLIGIACERDAATPLESSPPVVYPAETAESLAALERDTRAAALHGVDYLYARRSSLPPEWGVSTFSMLTRLAPDEALATRMRAALDEALATPQAELPRSLESEALLDPKQLRPVLNELWRRRLTKGAWREGSAELRTLFPAREDALWKAVPLDRQLLYLHFLHRVEVPTRLRMDDVTGELRWMWAVGDQEALLLDAAYMYAVTHVVYVGSGYFEKRLDPAQHEPEIAVFERALERYARGLPADSNFVDIAGEILACRKLLGLPETGASRAVTRRLLEGQNPDGSWLEPKGFQDIHATASAVHGLLDHPPEYRKLGPGPG